jgi:hypothetical protein
MALQFRLDHVAVGVESLQGTSVLARRFGCVPNRGYAQQEGQEAGPGFNAVQWAFRNGARLECISPAGDPGSQSSRDFLWRFLRDQRTKAEKSVTAQRGETASQKTGFSAVSDAVGDVFGHRVRETRIEPATGNSLHHLTIYVNDIDAACRMFTEDGIDVVGRVDVSRNWKEAFLHPKSTKIGIVVQLAQVAPYTLRGMEKTLKRPNVMPESVNSDLYEHRKKSTGAYFLGLVLSTTDSYRLTRLLDMLGAVRPTEEPIFRWLSAPLYVRVVEQGFDGPVGLDMGYTMPDKLGFVPEVGANFIVPPDAYHDLEAKL